MSFVSCVDTVTLEMIHRFVQALDAYFGNVCELDIINNMSEAYNILDEVFLGGEMVESSLKSVMKALKRAETAIMEDELRRHLVGDEM